MSDRPEKQAGKQRKVAELPHAESADDSQLAGQHGNYAAEPTGPIELGGPEGPEPTRFGDWERKGRCIDF